MPPRSRPTNISPSPQARWNPRHRAELRRTTNRFIRSQAGLSAPRHPISPTARSIREPRLARACRSSRSAFTTIRTRIAEANHKAHRSQPNATTWRRRQATPTGPPVQPVGRKYGSATGSRPFFICPSCSSVTSGCNERARLLSRAISSWGPPNAAEEPGIGSSDCRVCIDLAALLPAAPLSSGAWPLDILQPTVGERRARGGTVCGCAQHQRPVPDSVSPGARFEWGEFLLSVRRPRRRLAEIDGCGQVKGLGHVTGFR